MPLDALQLVLFGADCYGMEHERGNHLAMVKLEATIRNPQGIHCRPSAAIVKELIDYDGHVSAQLHGETGSLKSVIEMLSLCMEKGSVVSVRAEGPDEEQWCKRAVTLLEREFDFPPREEGQSVEDLIAEL